MGNSLHNKIRLGRATALHARGVQAALVVASCATIGVIWLLVRKLA